MCIQAFLVDAVIVFAEPEVCTLLPAWEQCVQGPSLMPCRTLRMLCLLDREGPGAGACALDWPLCWLECSWVVPICTNILHSR